MQKSGRMDFKLKINIDQLFIWLMGFVALTNGLAAEQFRLTDRQILPDGMYST